MRDKLQFGQLQVSSRFEKMVSPNRAKCVNFVAIEEFKDGEVDAKDLHERFAEDGIQCIRIVIGIRQRTWISISEIAVFVKKGIVNTTSPSPKNDTNISNTKVNNLKNEIIITTPAENISSKNKNNKLNADKQSVKINGTSIHETVSVASNVSITKVLSKYKEKINYTI